MSEASRVHPPSAREEMKRTPEPSVVSVGLGVPTRSGDRRCGAGVRFEPELPEAAPLAVLKLTFDSSRT